MVKILAVIWLGITFLKRTLISVLGTLDIYVRVKNLINSYIQNISSAYGTTHIHHKI
jgi:hypothetical protein